MRMTTALGKNAKGHSGFLVEQPRSRRIQVPLEQLKVSLCRGGAVGETEGVPRPKEVGLGLRGGGPEQRRRADARAVGAQTASRGPPPRPASCRRRAPDRG